VSARPTYTPLEPSSRAHLAPLRIECVLFVCRHNKECFKGPRPGGPDGRHDIKHDRPMPVSLTNSRLIYDALKECDIRLVSALPETWLVHLIRLADEDPEVILVRLAKEEEGVGVSAGAHFAGVKSAMLMQNHGLLASMNGIVSFAHLYKIPLLMLISYRGSFGERDPWQTQGGNVTEPLLRALGIPYVFLDAVETVKKRIRQAQTLAESSLQPVALLLTRDLMWEE
jgi:sulfopyruvate decarboxylase subunit alpha